MSMDWRRLLSTRRLGKPVPESRPPPPRTEFVRDYDRLVFSSAFRRLQDKTQVFPLAKSDYVRTRLTHSLEVASVGRSLGMLAAEVIRSREPELEPVVIPQDLGTLVAAACLAHDIGNPPFGHAGEDAIREWFAGWPGLDRLSEAESRDLLKFEGNAQGFRVLCTLQNSGQRGGMQMTCAALAVFSKYPRASLVDEEQSRGAGGRKFGFFQSEADWFELVAGETGLIAKPGRGEAWSRHPLAFLMEAADDICYHVIDVEDGYKTGVVGFDQLMSLHAPFLAQKHRDKARRFPDPAQQASYYRSVTIDRLIREAVVVFGEHYEGLMTGAFDRPLTESIEHAEAFAAFKDLAERQVYHCRPATAIKVCGFEVIGGLLQTFLGAIETRAQGRAGARAAALLRLMPGGDADFQSFSPYRQALAATDFVAGMTDSYAVELYQRIRGISLP
ncbi:dGTP triphosphohydrolase [Methylohalobius crimeensis]|uniref:dGTP triphosphohydrolase n=1 Tax=Methylohalobius crimeensis TaxID=244365 RepID=UPI0003B36F4D|nr:dNTP triphosphohydrolase [Methylohalobius crimeensis]